MVTTVGVLFKKTIMIIIIKKLLTLKNYDNSNHY